MSTSENGVLDRASLGFSREVEKRFEFLKKSGFRCVQSEPTFVRFESSTIGINVYYVRFEIGLEIEPLPPPNEFNIYPYSLSMILNLVGHPHAQQYRNYATHTAEGVAEGVLELAKLFREVVDTGVLNDSQLFSRLALKSKEAGRKMALESNIRQALRKAEAAWRKKDLAKVIEVLGPIQEHLGSVDRKKLEYARKHVQRGKA